MFDPVHCKPGMIVRSETPYNAEPPLGRLRAFSTTAWPDFYVRSHGNTPALDEADHSLHVAGRVGTPLDITVAELRAQFPKRTVQCAGNRRADMQVVRPTLGDPWAPGAIGNAEWMEVPFAGVSRAAGVKTDPSLHVAFDTCNEVEMPDVGRFTYDASITIAKAMSPEVPLAYSTNGEPSAPAHGYPLRVVVPGFAGVCSPKWLTAITVQDKPFDNHMQQRDNKLVPSDATAETVDWAKSITIYDTPLNYAIYEPASRAELKAGSITRRGYAIATARQIMGVDVSRDRGCTWQQVAFTHNANAPWSWTFWSATFDLTKGAHELAGRAWDAAGQTQPERPEDIGDFKGYLSTAWHRVHVSAS